ncbi:MAG TPA: Gfo/Idh/MocA family oxidoreductase [Acidimicrobiia bacterium]|nr:Gfo/Idh/MocA family oxidoreductase [Acidimicrobiia bacterium]
MTEPLRIGLIGAGPWTRMMTGPILAAGPQTRVTGVWSRTPEHAHDLGAVLDAPAFDDLDALLDACDAVSIAVTPAAQPELAIRAARAGRTLLLEKPLGSDVAAARTVADAVGEAGVGALVMLTYRFDPAFPAFLAEVERIKPIGGRACFISGAFLGGPFAQGWRLERGAVLDIGPHVLDMIEAGLGEIVSVAAVGDPLGWVSVNCTHASGATSSVSMCCTAATASGRTEIDVYSPTGTAFYDARAVDREARADQIRTDLVAVAGGAAHAANVDHCVHLQELIAEIETQLSEGS